MLKFNEILQIVPEYRLNQLTGEIDSIGDEDGDEGIILLKYKAKKSSLMLGDFNFDEKFRSG